MKFLYIESFVSRHVDNISSPRRYERWLVPDAGVQETKKHAASFIREWDEYNDDRYAFLRQQEVPRCASVSHRQRMAIVDWMVDFHTAAATISGGGHPLSLESLFCPSMSLTGSYPLLRVVGWLLPRIARIYKLLV